MSTLLLDSLTEAINRGEIYKFLTKPWEDVELINAVRDAFRHYSETTEVSHERHFMGDRFAAGNLAK